MACCVDVASGKLGNVVVIVEVMDAVIAEGAEVELAAEIVVAVTLDTVERASIPIIGGSLPLIP